MDPVTTAMLVLKIGSALLGLASIVTKITPTPKDDYVLHWLTGFFSLLKPGDQPGLLKLPFTSPAPPAE
jgi:hypothetical protein